VLPRTVRANAALEPKPVKFRKCDMCRDGSMHNLSQRHGWEEGIKNRTLMRGGGGGVGSCARYHGNEVAQWTLCLRVEDPLPAVLLCFGWCAINPFIDARQKARRRRPVT
jgi:hypothetical protein